MNLRLQIERIQIEFFLIAFQSQEVLNHNFLYHSQQIPVTFHTNPRHAGHDHCFLTLAFLAQQVRYE